MANKLAFLSKLDFVKKIHADFCVVAKKRHVYFSYGRSQLKSQYLSSMKWAILINCRKGKFIALHLRPFMSIFV